MLDRLLQTWWSLPALSAILLILSFHPFNIWPLAFVALVPLYYFAARSRASFRLVFTGGFVTGSLFALSLSYFTVIQFRWIPEAHLFTDLVHFSFIPIGLLGGVQWGMACVIIYRLLRTRYLLLNVFTGAAAYVVAEMALYALCGGYFFAMLGYTASSVPFFVGFASLGGVFLVSFLVAFVNSAFAEGLVVPTERLLHTVTNYGAVVAVLGAVFATNTWYLDQPAVSFGSVSVAAIQVSTHSSLGFGVQKEGGQFVFTALAEHLRIAGASKPDLLIYPFSPVEGALYVGQKPSLNKNILIATRDSFIQWTKALLPASTTLMVWTTLYEQEKFFNVFEFIQNGALVSEYRKREIFPFIDFTPQWAQRIGFFTTQIDVTAGTHERARLQELPIGAMLCSEIHRQPLARADAKNSLLLISAGSEAIFVDGVASEYSLKAAQFRAAENNLPAVRANVLGPSAVIDRKGSIVARLDRGEEGVLHGTMEVSTPHQTLYNRFGNSVMGVVVSTVLLTAFAVRFRSRYNI